jgi:putative phosphoribosyl transferase
MILHPLFKDRRDAGKQLGGRLEKYAGLRPLVLALPRGGVAIGFEVAKKLNALLDVFVARKLGAPGNPEFGIGAIAEGGIEILSEREVSLLGMTKRDLAELVTNKAIEVEKYIAKFRGNRHNPQVENRTVILVDDGIATGFTARAVIASIRLANPKELVFAVPVCPRQIVTLMRSLVEEFVCLQEMADFYAVGMWYEDFAQMADKEAIKLLELAHQIIIPDTKI